MELRPVMSDVDDETARRLARLAQRRAPNRSTASSSVSAPRAASGSAPWGPPSSAATINGHALTQMSADSSPTVGPASAHLTTNDARSRSRRAAPSGRRHHALAAKVISTGLATSGFLATVGSLATHGAAPTLSSAPSAGSQTETTIITETIHRVVYVDEYGNPVAAPSTTDAPVAPSVTTTIRRAAALPSAAVAAVDSSSTIAGSPAIVTPPISAAPGEPVAGLAGVAPPDTTLVAVTTGAPQAGPSNTVPASTSPRRTPAATTPPPAPGDGGSPTAPAPIALAPPSPAAPAPAGPIVAAPVETTAPPPMPAANAAPPPPPPPPTTQPPPPPPPPPPAATDDPAATATTTAPAATAATDDAAGAPTDNSAPAAGVHRFQVSPVTLLMSRERVWMRSSAPMMGTTAEVLIDGDASMVRAAFARLRSLESILTRFRPDSDLNQLHTRRGEWVRVSPELFNAFVWSERMYRETHGLFDPTIRTSLESSGYSSTFSNVVDDDRALDPPIPAPGFDSVDIDRSTQSVRIAPGVSVDLGGVGKGLCADIVARELVSGGARSAYVSLGGDIHAAGEPPETGFWQVPLVHPISTAIIAEHQLVSGGLVMSTVSMRAWKRGGATVHHIIDPRSGCSTNTDVVGVAVAARSAARAEALAKAAIVLGAADGAAFLARCDVTAWVITGTDIVAVGEFSCSQ